MTEKTAHEPPSAVSVVLSLLVIGVAGLVVYAIWTEPSDRPSSVPQTPCEWAAYALDHAAGKTPGEIQILVLRHAVACGTLADEIAR